MVFSELLSQQQHYDWGLRALKTVLKGCGNILQSEKQKQKGEKRKGTFLYFTYNYILFALSFLICFFLYFIFS